MLTREMTLEAATDAELWTAFKEGDLQALDFIYKKFYSELYNYGLYFADQADTVLDCIQQVFSYLYEKRNGLGNTSNIKYYLFLCLKRAILGMTRKSKQTIAVDDFNVNKANELNGFPMEEDDASSAKLRTAINQLSGSQREIIYLTYYKNFSVEEIAGILSIAPRTVYNQTYMAMQKLKQFMS
jgi:RNA polymerase sigma factor (sigma-70 family)